VTAKLRPLVPGQIWLKEHPVSLFGARLLTRMTVIRLADGLVLHSPVEIDDATRAEIEALGEVRGIIAPSTVHHLFVASAQRAFPGARTFGIAGLDRKRKDLQFDELIGDELCAAWADEMDQVVIGNRVMREVDFFHRASRTLVLVDLVENFRDETPGTNVALRALIRVMGMWGRPRPAPELRWGPNDDAATRAALERLLAWDFDRAVIAHGEILDHDPKAAIREAWRLTAPPSSVIGS
jgi:hypothetical protein